MQIKVKNECFYCCSTFLSDSRGFTNEYNLYPIMSVKHHLACSWYYLLLSIDSTSGHLITEGNNACSWYYLLLSIDSTSGHLFTEGNNACSWYYLLLSIDSTSGHLFTEGNNACSWYYLLLSIDSTSGHLFTEGNNKYVSKKLYDSECHPVNKSCLILKKVT